MQLGAECSHPKLYVSAAKALKILCPDCNEWIALPECGVESVQKQETELD